MNLYRIATIAEQVTQIAIRANLLTDRVPKLHKVFVL